MRITGIEPARDTPPDPKSSASASSAISAYPVIQLSFFTSEKRKRVMGIEPTYLAWKASVLPLNYTRKYRGDRIRTCGLLIPNQAL